MKLMITGAGGQLGTALCNALTQSSKKLIIDSGYQLSEYIAVDLAELDITDFEAVMEIVSLQKPDILINCAAMTNVEECETEPEKAMQINAIGARNLAIACEKLGATMVQISTDYVFDGNKTLPYSETDACNPQNVYGKTKLLGEQYVHENCKKHFIVRTAWLYGEGERNFVKTILCSGMEKSELLVVDDQTGNPTNANDLAHQILKLIATQHYGIYHCTGAGECSRFEFASNIIKYANLSCNVIPCKTQDIPQKAKRPRYSSLNNEKINVLLGQPMRNWKDALQDYIKNKLEAGKR